MLDRSAPPGTEPVGFVALAGSAGGTGGTEDGALPGITLPPPGIAAAAGSLFGAESGGTGGTALGI